MILRLLYGRAYLSVGIEPTIPDKKQTCGWASRNAAPKRWPAVVGVVFDLPVVHGPVEDGPYTRAPGKQFRPENAIMHDIRLNFCVPDSRRVLVGTPGTFGAGRKTRLEFRCCAILIYTA